MSNGWDGLLGQAALAACCAAPRPNVIVSSGAGLRSFPSGVYGATRTQRGFGEA